MNTLHNHFLRSAVLVLALCVAYTAVPSGADGQGERMRTTCKSANGAAPITDYRGRSLMITSIPAGLVSSPGKAPGESVLTSATIDLGIAANEIVVSWNAETLPGSGLKVEARAIYPDKTTKYYTLGIWSKDGVTYPRESVKDQKDTDGDVLTDTLALVLPAHKLQVRVTLTSGAAPGSVPKLKFLSISAADTHTSLAPLEPNREAWGKEITVPGRTQLGWPGASGWCSPTSTDMVLAFWSERMKRPELDISVPDAAHAIFDSVWQGTGNWPFNTAFAGSFPGIRAYVTRLSDVRELEDWIVVGTPPIVSVSYDLLKGKDTDNDPGHLLVCDGFTADGDIVLNDPAHHPEKGEACRRVFPRSNFIKAWGRSHFTVYLIYPEDAKLPVDRYRHWARR